MSKEPPEKYTLELEGWELLVIVRALERLPFRFRTAGLLEKVEQQIHHPRTVNASHLEDAK